MGARADWLRERARLRLDPATSGPCHAPPPCLLACSSLTQTRLRIDTPASAAPMGFIDMARSIVAKDGPGGLMTGWQARVGYWAPAIGIFLSCYCFIRQLAVTQEFFV